MLERMRTDAFGLDNTREQVQLCEQLGFDAVWLPEHHLNPEGLGNSPNPILFAADLACRTSRIRKCTRFSPAGPCFRWSPPLVSCSLLTDSWRVSSLEIGYDICAQYPNGLQGRLPFVEGAPEQNVGDARPFHVLQIFDAFGGAADDQ